MVVVGGGTPLNGAHDVAWHFSSGNVLWMFLHLEDLLVHKAGALWNDGVGVQGAIRAHTVHALAVLRAGCDGGKG